MQVQDERTQEESIQALQQQVDELTAENLLLKEQLARKEQFAAMIAHELRGPLTPIINYAQIAARPNQRRENIVRAANIITGQAWRLARLAKDLLDASHLSSGRFTLSCHPCDAVKLIKDVVEQVRPVAPYHTFAIEAPEEPVIGCWDAGRLEQALGNLLDNAIKYSDEETTITVSAWKTENAAHISVHNVGISIPASQKNQLFHPYTRLPGSGTQRGSGLGLYITKSIVEAHGGELRLELSTSNENSTTFVFDLPMEK
ncbi:MAG TPA: HAMP domain-containing sensor histidine kinase [Ktedonobacteraceae bacterium]|jgi:signal transduction histidine kinase|nr:HAMP domain-containing sensor histidine kinase [Ktedonobacteraceae bacterium]